MPWLPQGVDPLASHEHKEYLKQFCDNFINDCLKLTEMAMQTRENLVSQAKYYSDYIEIVHHLQFCLSKCNAFCGREDVSNLFLHITAYPSWFGCLKIIECVAI